MVVLVRGDELSLLVSTLENTIFSGITVEIYRGDGSTVYVSRYPSFISIVHADYNKFENIILNSTLALVNIGTFRAVVNKPPTANSCCAGTSIFFRRADELANEIEVLDLILRKLVRGEIKEATRDHAGVSRLIELRDGIVRTVIETRASRDYNSAQRWESGGTAIIDAVRRGITIVEEEAMGWGASERRITVLSPPPMRAGEAKTYECCGRDWLLTITLERLAHLGGVVWRRALWFTPLVPPAGDGEVDEIARGVFGIIAGIDGEAPRDPRAYLLCDVDVDGRFAIKADDFYDEELASAFSAGFDAVVGGGEVRGLLRAVSVRDVVEYIISVAAR